MTGYSDRTPKKGNVRIADNSPAIRKAVSVDGLDQCFGARADDGQPLRNLSELDSGLKGDHAGGTVASQADA
jgi:hypothetical protein